MTGAKQDKLNHYQDSSLLHNKQFLTLYMYLASNPIFDFPILTIYENTYIDHSKY